MFVGPLTFVIICILFSLHLSLSLCTLQSISMFPFFTVIAAGVLLLWSLFGGVFFRFAFTFGYVVMSLTKSKQFLFPR